MRKKAFDFKFTFTWADGSVTSTILPLDLGNEHTQRAIKEIEYALCPQVGRAERELSRNARRAELVGELLNT